jgi:hypothetical protein
VTCRAALDHRLAGHDVTVTRRLLADVEADLTTARES